MKLVGQGQIEIVDDPKEREFLMESIRKDRENQAQIKDVKGENLMDRFNEDDDGPLE